MPRYIDADETIELLRSLGSRDYRREKGTICDAIKMLQYPEYTPTADVVPKSEVDSEIKVWQELYADTVSKWEKAYEELEIKLENAKAEVAREIFEEIESLLKRTCEKGYCGSISDLFAELKKKYLEASTDEV